MSRIVYVPADVKVWEPLGPVPDIPSPKSQLYVMIVPSGSCEPEASSLTDSGAVPEDGVTMNWASGGFGPESRFAELVTAICWYVESVCPALSFTVSRMVYLPADVNE